MIMVYHKSKIFSLISLFVSEFMSLYSTFLSVFISICTALDDTSDTGAILTFTDIHNGRQKLDVAQSSFGFESYNQKDSIQGWLVLASDIKHHDGCGIDNSIYHNGYVNWVRETIDPNDDYGFIMVLDIYDRFTHKSGDCWLTRQVEYAQKIGAKACIVVDDTPENLFNMWMIRVSSNWHDFINIPSVLLGKRDGEILYQHLGV